jgi:hypothetical protein
VSSTVQSENNQVVANLSATSQLQLAQALTTLTQAVLSSRDLPADEKEEQIFVINQIGREAAKSQTNKTVLKILVNGLLTTLRVIPDVADAVKVVAPIFKQLQGYDPQLDQNSLVDEEVLRKEEVTSEEPAYGATGLDVHLHELPPENSPLDKELIGSYIGQDLVAHHFAFPTPWIARYTGSARLPKKVYEGDSQNISLILDRKLLVQGLQSETLFTTEDAVASKQVTLKRVTLDIQREDSREQFLEVELLAAALSIEGEKKQKQSLSLEKLTYQWNCQYKSAGTHEICLILKVVHQSGKRSIEKIKQKQKKGAGTHEICLVLKVLHPSGERSLGRIEQTFRVVKFDHATQHQVQIAAAITGAIALLGTAATLLSTVLGLWHLPYK